MIPIIPAGSTPVVTENRTLETSFRTFLNELVDQYPMSGVGSPEGVVSAMPLRQYMDTAGITGSILYVKRDESIGGDRTLGWILV
jgi:hypothetical protein